MVYCLQNGNDYTGEWLKKEKIMLQNKEERENFWKLCGEHDLELKAFSELFHVSYEYLIDGK